MITKSGTTGETMSQFLVIRRLLEKKLGARRVAEHLVAITDGQNGRLRNVADRLRGYFGDLAALERGRDTSRGLTVVAVLLPLEHAHGGAPRHEGVA